MNGLDLLCRSRTDVTIVLPCYFGSIFLLEKINIFKSLCAFGFHIIVCDDSCDEDEWKKISEINSSVSSHRFKIYRNEANLGMDGNFYKCVQKSETSYVWFCGQDDLIEIEHAKIIDDALCMHQPDLVFANYVIRKTWKTTEEYVLLERKQESMSGYGTFNFLLASKLYLPSFLPSLLVKRDFYLKNFCTWHVNTVFSQLATALNLLRLGGKWCVVYEPCSIGVIPSYGWQSKSELRFKYFCGYIDVIADKNLIESKFLRFILCVKETKQFISLLESTDHKHFMRYMPLLRRSSVYFSFISRFRVFLSFLVRIYRKC